MAKKSKLGSRDAVRYANIKIVSGWIAKGFSKASLRVLIEEKFGLRSINAQNRLIGEAMTEIASEIDKAGIREMVGTKLDAIAQATMEKEDYKTAIKALAEYAKVMNLGESKEVSITDKNSEFNCTIKFGE